MIYELRTYVIPAGRMPDILERFENVTMDLFARHGGGFNALHIVATDSSGNLYTGEVDPNNRVQRFLVQ